MFKNLFSAQTFVTVLLALIAIAVVYFLFFQKTVMLAPATMKDSEGKDVTGYAGIVKHDFTLPSFGSESKAA